jgi:hypothetical protein
MGVKEIVILVAILVLGYWLGKNGVLASYLPS